MTLSAVFLTLDPDAASRLADALEETRLLFEHAGEVFQLAASSAFASSGVGSFDPIAWASVFELSRRALTSGIGPELMALSDLERQVRQGMSAAHRRDAAFASMMAGMAGSAPPQADETQGKEEP